MDQLIDECSVIQHAHLKSLKDVEKLIKIDKVTGEFID